MERGARYEVQPSLFFDAVVRLGQLRIRHPIDPPPSLRLPYFWRRRRNLTLTTGRDPARLWCSMVAALQILAQRDSVEEHS